MKVTDDFNKAMEEYIWIDIQTMYHLSEEQYGDYIKWTFDVDHHDVLRLQRGDEPAPLATTLEQLELLIDYLEDIREKMVSKNE